MKALRWITTALVIVGAINWGLWGFFQFDLVNFICNGDTNWPSRVIYSLIGLSGLWKIKCIFEHKCCSIHRK
jgi:uncharacterized membrane protein YuzA (DUF378 family)